MHVTTTIGWLVRLIIISFIILSYSLFLYYFSSFDSIYFNMILSNIYYQNVYSGIILYCRLKYLYMSAEIILIVIAGSCNKMVGHWKSPHTQPDNQRQRNGPSSRVKCLHARPQRQYVHFIPHCGNVVNILISVVDELEDCPVTVPTKNSGYVLFHFYENNAYCGFIAGN